MDKLIEYVPNYPEESSVSQDIRALMVTLVLGALLQTREPDYTVPPEKYRFEMVKEAVALVNKILEVVDESS